MTTENNQQEEKKDIKDEKVEVKDDKKDVPNTVSREAYEKLLKEKRNAMSAIDELKKQVDNLAVNEMKAKEDFKSLYEKSEKEKVELMEKLNGVTNKIVNGKKLGQARKELEKIGADSKTMEFLLSNVKLDSLKYDEEHEIVLGVEEEAKRIYEAIPQAFGKQTAKTDASAPDITGSGLSLDAWKSMPLADKRKHMADIYKAHNIPVKK